MASITVGFIGTGAMGEHMCRNIAKNGDHPVIAFDLSPTPLNRLSNHGVIIAESAMDAAIKSDVLILSLPGGPEVEAVANDTLLSPKLSGLTIIDMSTTPVKLTREIAVSYTHLTLPTNREV